MLEEKLEEIGLRPNEAKIYLALLRTGPATPSQVAKITGLSRSYVYDALENLKSKALAAFQIKNFKKHYCACDPRHLEEAAEAQLAKTRKIVPELLKSMETAPPSEVSVFEGRYIYKALLRDITGTLKANDEILIFGIDDQKIMETDKYYAGYLNQYFSILGKKKISERVIVKRGTKRITEAKTTRYRFLEERYFTDTAFEVYGDRLVLFHWSEPSRLIVIKDAKITDAYSKQFEILWNLAKERD